MTKCTLLRGGTWGNTPVNCRSAYRLHNPPSNASHYVGFRVVCVADKKPIERVPLRGGSWCYVGPRNCRSAFRSRNLPDLRLDTVGFRVCCPAPKSRETK